MVYEFGELCDNKLTHSPAFSCVVSPRQSPTTERGLFLFLVFYI